MLNTKYITDEFEVGFCFLFFVFLSRGDYHLREEFLKIKKKKKVSREIADV